MRKWILALILAVSVEAQAPKAPAQSPQPKLVLSIMVDQFRYDYLTRFRSEFTGGLKRLLEEGRTQARA